MVEEEYIPEYLVDFYQLFFLSTEDKIRSYEPKLLQERFSWDVNKKFLTRGALLNMQKNYRGRFSSPYMR